MNRLRLNFLSVKGSMENYSPGAAGGVSVFHLMKRCRLNTGLGVKETIILAL